MEYRNLCFLQRCTSISLFSGRRLTLRILVHFVASDGSGFRIAGASGHGGMGQGMSRCEKDLRSVPQS